MKLKPFKELVGKTKEAIDEALAPLRERQVKAQAELEVAKLDEKLITLETQVQELCANKTIDFDKVIEKMNEYDLTERRKTQLEKIVVELFPK